MTRPGEKGAVRKVWGTAIPVALVYPNKYQLGMGNLGFQFLYHTLNSHHRFLAERFFISEASFQNQAYGLRLLSEESGRPLESFAVIAFSIPFENDFIRVVEALASSSIPLLSKDRKAEDPIIIAGGVSVSLNPEPLAHFLDLIFIGELGESTFSDGLFGVLAQVCRLSSRPRIDRSDVLRAFQYVPGVYVPSAYTFRFGENGLIEEIQPEIGFPKTVAAVKRLEKQGPVLASVMFSEEAAFGDSLLVEVNRGCGRGCRFCAGGWIHSPIRYASLRRLRKQMEGAGAQGRTVGLIGSDLAGHPELGDILNYIVKTGGKFSLSSIRPEGLTPEIVRLMAKSGQKTATLAPEVASDRMKRVVGKRIPSDRFYEIVEQLVSEGIRNIRFYFMVGLPTETDEDVLAIVDFISTCRKLFVNASRNKKHVGNMSVQLNPFVPKPWTPFQWASMESLNALNQRIRIVMDGLRKTPNVTVRCESVREALIQGLLSRGDRRIGHTLLDTSFRSGNLTGVLKKFSPQLAFYLKRERFVDEIFPWEVTYHGVARQTLRSLFEKALSG